MVRLLGLSLDGSAVAKLSPILKASVGGGAHFQQWNGDVGYQFFSLTAHYTPVSTPDTHLLLGGRRVGERKASEAPRTPITSRVDISSNHHATAFLCVCFF